MSLCGDFVCVFIALIQASGAGGDALDAFHGYSSCLMLGTELGNARERRLIKRFRTLNATDREILSAFAEFLVQRQAGGDSAAGGQSLAIGDAQQQAPVREPRPATESVIAAMKRLRRAYPKLDASDLLNQASLLMSAHMIQGRPAVEIIDELEELFARHERERSRGPE